MGKLSVYLPPFAGDYSGVCSTLFDLNCLIVLCDANCCAKNYIDYDEPRRSRKEMTAACARLMTLEAMPGDDRRLIDRIAEAAEAKKPEFIAVLGSPVPAIAGMDMAGIANEAEERIGIPVLGFNTTGFSSYRRGAEMAMHALYCSLVHPRREKYAGMVNILGATPLDLGAVGNDRALRETIEQAGFSVGSVFSMGSSREQLGEASAAEVNLVVSAAGLSLAKKMESERRIPYVARIPLGKGGAEGLRIWLKRAVESGKSRMPEVCAGNGEENGILLVGDLVFANSLRLELRDRGCTRPITVGSFFVSDSDSLLPGDVDLKQESDLIGLLRSGRFTTLIGDPLLTRIPDSIRLKFFSLPHPAVSSYLYWDEVLPFTDAKMDAWIEKILSEEDQIF